MCKIKSNEIKAKKSLIDHGHFNEIEQKHIVKIKKTEKKYQQLKSINMCAITSKIRASDILYFNILPTICIHIFRQFFLFCFLIN